MSSSQQGDQQKNNWMGYPAWMARLFASQRYFAYTSEVGESFRPLIPRPLVNTAYGISIGYVFADVYVNTHDQFQKTKDIKKTSIMAGDLLLWHTFASMVFPAVSIHSIVKYSGKAMDFTTIKNVPIFRRWLPTLLGLGSIPFIIHPLDRMTDYLMDKSIRRFYNVDRVHH